eukprot:91731_1
MCNKHTATDCSRLQLNVTQQNVTEQILLDWNNPNRIGYFASHYWTLWSLWIPVILILIMSICIPYLLFNIFYPKYDKKKKDELIQQRHTHKRSVIFAILSPYFGDNDDFLIFMILDFANITLNTQAHINIYNQIKTYTHKCNPKKTILVKNNHINNTKRYFCWAFGLLAFGYIFLFHFSIAIYYANNVFTRIDVYGEWPHHEEYIVIKDSSMKKVCDSQTINITEYKFVGENKYDAEEFYIHPSDLTFAVSSTLSIFGYVGGSGVWLVCIFYVCSTLFCDIIPELCNMERVFEGYDGVNIGLTNTTTHGDEIYTQINNDVDE